MRRNSSGSPKKKDFLISTMTTFSSKYMKEMKALADYQRQMDERLSKPKKRGSSKKKCL